MRFFKLTTLIAILTTGAFAQAVTGTITATSADCATAHSCVTVTGVSVNASVAFQVTGTFTATLVTEATVDGTNWVAIAVLPPGSTAVTRVLEIVSPGAWQTSVSGYTKFRVRCSSYTSGTATVIVRRTNYPVLVGAG